MSQGPASETDPQDSDPHGAGPEGLRGDMGISSGRTGPFAEGASGELGDSPSSSLLGGIEGTGSHGTAASSTEGTMSTERKHSEEPAEGRDDIGTGADTPSSADAPGGAPGAESGAASADGPEMDDTQQAATQEWRDSQPPAGGGA